MQQRTVFAIVVAVSLCSSVHGQSAQTTEAYPQAAAEPTVSPAVQPLSDAEPKLTPSVDLADSLSARGRFLAAIHVYEVLQPRSASIENKQGVACEHMMMNDRARQSFEAAIKLDPKYAEAWNNMGTLLHSTGEYGRAEKMYEKANKIRPSAKTYQNLGTLYFAQNKFKKGNDAYKKALAIDPHILDRAGGRSIPAAMKTRSMSEIHYQMAITSAQAGNRPAALEYLRKAVLAGFRDRNRLLHERDFADLRTAPAFLQMADEMRKN